MTEQDPLIGIRTVPGCTCDQLRREHAHRYELLEKIGEGGMGAVYKALDLDPPKAYVQKYPDTPRVMAVKYLDPSLLMGRYGAVVVERFKREAKIGNKIKHRNIVRVVNIGLDDEGKPLLVMEYIDGARTLADLIAKAKADFAKGVRRHPVTGKINGSLIPPSHLFPILSQLADALGILHAHAIVHRDMKPENCLILQRPAGPRPMLTDFGIVKHLNDDKDEPLTKLTQEGTVIGTPQYMAPEQMGVPKLHPETKAVYGVGPRTDIWALGVVAYELVSGELPFHDEGIQVVMAMIANDNEPPRPIEEYVEGLDPALKRFIEACMTKAPWNRPASIDEVHELLLEAQASVLGPEGHDTLDAPPSDPPSAIQPKPADRRSASATVKAPARNKRFPVAFLAAFFLLGMVGTFFYLVGNKPLPEAPEGQPVAGPPAVLPAQASQASTVVPAVSPGTAAVSPQRSSKREPDPGPRAGEPLMNTYEEGMRAFRQGNCPMAERLLNRVVARFPAFPPPLKALAACALRAGRRMEASKYAQKYDDFEVAEPLGPELQALLSL
jgi:serine/threonine-protein kinase